MNEGLQSPPADESLLNPLSGGREKLSSTEYVLQQYGAGTEDSTRLSLGKRILANKYYTCLIFLAAIVSVLGDDLIVIALPTTVDTGYRWVTFGILVFFIYDMGLNLWSYRKGYIFTLFCPLDLIATLTMVPTILPLFGGPDLDSGALIFARLGRVAKAAARAGKMAKFLKMLKQWSLLKSKQQDTVEEDDNVSKAGNFLQSMTIRNVVLLVLLMFFVPVGFDVLKSREDPPHYLLVLLNFAKSDPATRGRVTPFLKDMLNEKLLYVVLNDEVTYGQSVTESLRSAEIETVTVKDEVKYEIQVNIRERQVLLSVLSISQAVYLFILLIVGNHYFIKDVMELFIKPVSYMVETLAQLEKNPFSDNFAEPISTCNEQEETQVVLSAWNKMLQSVRNQAAKAKALADMVTGITFHIALMDLDAAAELLNKAVHTDLYAQFSTIILWLRQYKPFLPKALFVEEEGVEEVPAPILTAPSLPLNTPDNPPQSIPKAPKQDDNLPPPVTGYLRNPSSSSCSKDEGAVSSGNSSSEFGLRPLGSSRLVKAANTVKLAVKAKQNLQSLSSVVAQSIAASITAGKSARQPSMNSSLTLPERFLLTYQERRGTVISIRLWSSTELVPQRTNLTRFHGITETLAHICTECIEADSGLVLSFCGDSVIGTFNCHRPHADHVYKACHAALQIRSRLSNDQAFTTPLGDIVMEVLIAIHTGHVLIGNAGTTDCKQPCVVGPVMDTILRVQKLNKVVGSAILLTQMVQEQVSSSFQSVIVDYVDNSDNDGGRMAVYELLSGQAAPVWDKAMSSYKDAFHSLGEYDFENASAMFPVTLKTITTVLSTVQPDTPQDEQSDTLEVAGAPYYRTKAMSWNSTITTSHETRIGLAFLRQVVRVVRISDYLSKVPPESRPSPLRRCDGFQRWELFCSSVSTSPELKEATIYLEDYMMKPSLLRSSAADTVLSSTKQETSVVVEQLKTIGERGVAGSLLSLTSQRHTTQDANLAACTPNLLLLNSESIQFVATGSTSPVIRTKSGADVTITFNADDFTDDGSPAVITENERSNQSLSPHPLAHIPSAATVFGNAAPILDSTSGTVTFQDNSKRTWVMSTTVLGRGGFGAVNLGISSAGQLVAIKTIDFQEEESEEGHPPQTELLINEISLLTNLQHDNIVSYYSSCILDYRLAIVMEYVSCGSLANVMRKFGKLQHSIVSRYTRDILRGMEFLHMKGVVHRDIKPSNVLLNHAGECKLADFGTAGRLKPPGSADGPSGFVVQGTPHYMGPECMKGQGGAAGDIWALGITILELLTTDSPWATHPNFDADNPVAVMFNIATTDVIPIIPDYIAPDAESFILACCTRDPSKRPTAKQLLGHPFCI